MSFEGFDKRQVQFFKTLARKQDRDWFKAHKAEYEALCERPMKDLFNALQPMVARQYKGFVVKPPKHFRIYRDVRFSKDKTPYKTHVSAVLHLRGGDDEGAPAALYMHLGTDDFAGAGHWMLPSVKLVRYRELVADDELGAELHKRVRALQKKGFGVESFEALKRVPPGYRPDHPRAELLKLKGLGISFPEIPPAVRFSPKLLDWVAARSAEASKLVMWLEQQLA